MKLTKERAKILIGACEKLLVTYSVDTGKDRPVNLTGECPLCTATTSIMGSADHECEMCPWELFESRGCLETNNASQRRYCDQTITTRRRRIRKWISFLRKI